MEQSESQIYRAILVTRGRKTGIAHSVKLRAVKYRGKFYFSRHRPDSDWFRNALSNPQVEIKIEDSKFLGKASRVTDNHLEDKISELKYPGEERAKEKRVAIEVTLD